jgi:L-alanine-DL-glutamate epimerase-like enolase superfamily enzyme
VHSKIDQNVSVTSVTVVARPDAPNGAAAASPLPGGAVPNFRHDNQAYRALLRDDVVKDFGGPVENYLGGHLDVPSGPGLGIELDLVRVAAVRGVVPQPR